MSKRPYHPPTLTRLGSVAELTGGHAASGAPGPRPPPAPHAACPVCGTADCLEHTRRRS